MRISSCLMGLLAVLLSPSAFADTVVQDISGSVMISRGDGYTRVEQLTVLLPGDAVMTRRSGSAKLVYEDGCEITIAPNSVVVVEQASPCKISSANSNEMGFAVGAAGILATTIVMTRKPREPISP